MTPPGVIFYLFQGVYLSIWISRHSNVRGWGSWLLWPKTARAVNSHTGHRNRVGTEDKLLCSGPLSLGPLVSFLIVCLTEAEVGVAA